MGLNVHAGHTHTRARIIDRQRMHFNIFIGITDLEDSESVTKNNHLCETLKIDAIDQCAKLGSIFHPFRIHSVLQNYLYPLELEEY